MTGYFVRIQRGQKFEAVEIDQMTDNEIDNFFADLALHNPVRAGYWGSTLAKWIRNNVNEKEGA